MKQSMALLAAMTFAATAHAQAERGKAEATIAGKKVAVDYGRPQLKGRDMLTRAPEGMVWRMGMNEATTIETAGDLQFGDVTIPKGAYSLFAKRTAEKSWELIFNKQTGQWGTRHDPSKDVARVPLSWKTKDDSTETLTIEVVPQGKGGEFKMTWGTHVLETPFTVK